MLRIENGKDVSLFLQRITNQCLPPKGKCLFERAIYVVLTRDKSDELPMTSPLFRCWWQLQSTLMRSSSSTASFLLFGFMQGVVGGVACCCLAFAAGLDDDEKKLGAEIFLQWNFCNRLVRKENYISYWSYYYCTIPMKIKKVSRKNYCFWCCYRPSIH